MAKLKPWFHVVTPREDLREGKPLDASEFAVHLDHVREGRAPLDYQEPARFFDRTYLTGNLTDLAVQVVRRLSGNQVETSAVFNMATQFGGGKTHALTLLYHLAEAGPAAEKWRGVRTVLDRAQVATVPQAKTAVFVGTEFDSVVGRGGAGEEPRRFTPWGEIAWQLSGKEGFVAVAEHDRTRIAPAGDVIRAFLPTDQPALVLMDELMNYISRNRQSGLSAQLYNFIQNLSEEARAPQRKVVLAVSIPASELEMNPDDHRDYESLKKLLDRLGKAIIMAVETETAEIIRRRLFEWGGLPEDARRAAAAYADWIDEHRQIVGDFDADTARERFEASYPFHPALLSVFERKWQTLPRFQKTRGILRLLALWVSHAYQSGFKGAHRDPLIGLGTAPIADPVFRAALFEQLGNTDLEGAVTTDIAGRKDAHAVRLDREATDAVKQARLHQKVAATILFESNGGQTRAEATVPEIRLAVAEPDLDIANVETALEALTTSCYYLIADRNRYRFSQVPGLNKILTDRRANIKPAAIEDRVRKEVETVFRAGPATVERVYFPKTTLQVDNRAVLTLVVLPPERGFGDSGTAQWIEMIVREYGSSSRTFKSALIFAVAEGSTALQEEAKKLLAYEEIEDDEETVKRLDESQHRQLTVGLGRAGRDLKEAVWRTYHYVVLLGKDNSLKEINLGMINSSSSGSLVELILSRLRKDDEITEGVGPHKLVKYWPPALPEWSTKAMRDAFYASPTLPRLLDPNSLRRTIVDGVAQSILAYAGKDKAGRLSPLFFGPHTPLSEGDVEFSEDMFLVQADEAKRHIEPPKLARVEVKPERARVKPREKISFAAQCFDQHGGSYPCPPVAWSASGGSVDQKGMYVAESNVGYYTVTAKVASLEASAEVEVVREESVSGPTPPPPVGIRWQGEVPPQKWMNFYTKVLSRFVALPGLKLKVSFEVPSGDAVTKAKVDEAKTALRELGLSESLEER